MTKEINKVTSAISDECKYDLELLSSYLRLNLQKTVKLILEKYVPVLLAKEVNKKIKITTNVSEE